MNRNPLSETSAECAEMSGNFLHLFQLAEGLSGGPSVADKDAPGRMSSPVAESFERGVCELSALKTSRDTVQRNLLVDRAQ